MSPGPQLFEKISILSISCINALDSVASVDLMSSSKRRIPETWKKKKCFRLIRKPCCQAKRPIRLELISVSVVLLSVWKCFYSPPSGWDAGPSRDTSQHYMCISWLPIYILKGGGGGERWEAPMSVTCLAQAHNAVPVAICPGLLKAQSLAHKPLGQCTSHRSLPSTNKHHQKENSLGKDASFRKPEGASQKQIHWLFWQESSLHLSC